jgi:hypothetical protein
MGEGPHPTPQSASTLNGLGSSSRLVLKRLTNFSAVLPGGADLNRGQPDAPEELRNEARRLDVSAPDARRPSTVEGRLQNNTDSQRLRVKTARRRHIRPSTVEGRSPDQPLGLTLRSAGWTVTGDAGHTENAVIHDGRRVTLNG